MNNIEHVIRFVRYFRPKATLKGHIMDFKFYGWSIVDRAVKGVDQPLSTIRNDPDSAWQEAEINVQYGRE